MKRSLKSQKTLYFCSNNFKWEKPISLTTMSIEQLYHIFTQHPVVTTDSRDCPKGSIFFALKGANFNGNQFAKTALEKGCAYAVIDEPEFAENDHFIVTENCLHTLQMLAREHRRHCHIPVVGITGTNGKTTTKELVAAVLKEKYNVWFTQGNFNNDIGVPKTLLQLNQAHEIAVIEMGASHPGDIKTLVEVAEPDYGIITNVGRAHLQGFGSFEGVMKTKGELYDFLRTRPDGMVFIDANNNHLTAMAEGLKQVSYGTTEGTATPMVRGEIVKCAPTLCFRWYDLQGNSYTVQTHLIGSYNLPNMLAAATIGLHFGVQPSQINHALEHYVPSNNRSQMDTTEYNHLVMDAYNANPTSMEAAITNFHLMEVEEKMLILGDMKELGEVSHEEHQKIVDLLKTYGFTDVWLVGSEFASTASPYRHFADAEEVKQAIRQQQPRHKYILIKGSNSMKLASLKELL